MSSFFFISDRLQSKAKPKLKVLDETEASIITATFIIKVIDKGSLRAVFKDYPDHAKTALQQGMALLSDNAIAP